MAIDFNATVIPFVASTSVESATYSDAGVSNPKAVLTFLNSATVVQTAADDAIVSIGAATAADEEWLISASMEDAQTTMDSAARGKTDRVMGLKGNAAGWLAEADFTAFTATGLTVNWSDGAPFAYLGTALVLGGNDLRAKALSLAAGALDTEVNVDVGFEPDFFIVVNIGHPLDDVLNNDAKMSVGIVLNPKYRRGAKSGPIVQRAMAFFSDDNVATANCDQWILDRRGAARAAAGALLHDVEFYGFHDTGAKLAARTANAAASEMGLLACSIDGARYWLGDFQTPTTATTKTIPTGFSPIMYMMLQGLMTAKNTATAGLAFGIGMSDGAVHRCHSITDEDAVGTSNTASFVDSNPVYLPAQDQVLELAATQDSLTNLGPVLNFGTVANATARQWACFAIGDPSVLTLLAPAPFIQRNHKDKGVVQFSWTSTAPITSIEARVVNRGTETAVTGLDWQAVNSAGVTSGSFTLEVPAGGPYEAHIRDSGATTVAHYSNDAFYVGMIIVFAAAASNFRRPFLVGSNFTANEDVFYWSRSAAWDPSDEARPPGFHEPPSGNVGDSAITMGNLLNDRLGIPICLVPYAVSGSSMTREYAAGGATVWEPNDPDGASELQVLKTDLAELQGEIECIFLGNTGDAGDEDFDKTTYKAALTEIRDWILSNFKFPNRKVIFWDNHGSIAPPLSTGDETEWATFREATEEVFLTHPHCRSAGTVIDLELLADGAHLVEGANGWTPAGTQRAMAVLKGCSHEAIGEGPRCSHFVHVASANTVSIIINFNGGIHALTATSPAATAWEAWDGDGAALTVSSVAITGPDTVELTLSTSPAAVSRVAHSRVVDPFDQETSYTRSGGITTGCIYGVGSPPLPLQVSTNITNAAPTSTGRTKRLGVRAASAAR